MEKESLGFWTNCPVIRLEVLRVKFVETEANLVIKVNLGVG